MITSLRGMNDILDSKKFQYFLQTASQVAQNYGYSYVETPLLEETALFKRSVGESSDIVGKEMYQFTDKGGHDVCLRPEGTAGIVRAFIQNKLDKVGSRHKFFYHGPMFRYERPQKGRLREFHQFGCESFGEMSVYEDVTVIMMICDIFNKLDITFTLKLNSLGDSSCMPQYRENLLTFLQNNIDDICDDCKRRKDTNPIRVLDCKNDKCQQLYIDAPKLLNNLCATCHDDFEALKNILISNNINFEIDPHLVRGLDYYSKTAFEFISNGIGAQNAIAGGGRYDKLVEFLDGKATPAIGFAIGVERILELIQLPTDGRMGWYFGALDDEYISLIISLAFKKRKIQKAVTSLQARTLKAHLKAADKENVRYCAIIGENEFKEHKIWIKDMHQKNESIIDFNNI